MRFKPAVWHPIALGLAALNLVGAGAAAAQAEPWHAATHVVLALAFGWWARRLRSGPRSDAREDRLAELEAELDGLRLELGEAQERLDFAERMLAQRPEVRRVGPDESGP